MPTHTKSRKIPVTIDFKIMRHNFGTYLFPPLTEVSRLEHKTTVAELLRNEGATTIKSSGKLPLVMLL